MSTVQNLDSILLSMSASENSGLSTTELLDKLIEIGNIAKEMSMWERRSSVSTISFYVRGMADSDREQLRVLFQHFSKENQLKKLLKKEFSANKLIKEDYNAISHPLLIALDLLAAAEKQVAKQQKSIIPPKLEPVLVKEIEKTLAAWFENSYNTRLIQKITHISEQYVDYLQKQVQASNDLEVTTNNGKSSLQIVPKTSTALHSSYSAFSKAKKEFSKAQENLKRAKKNSAETLSNQEKLHYELGEQDLAIQSAIQSLLLAEKTKEELFSLLEDKQDQKVSLQENLAEASEQLASSDDRSYKLSTLENAYHDSQSKLAKAKVFFEKSKKNEKELLNTIKKEEVRLVILTQRSRTLSKLAKKENSILQLQQQYETKKAELGQLAQELESIEAGILECAQTIEAQMNEAQIGAEPSLTNTITNTLSGYFSPSTKKDKDSEKSSESSRTNTFFGLFSTPTKETRAVEKNVSQNQDEPASNERNIIADLTAAKEAEETQRQEVTKKIEALNKEVTELENKLGSQKNTFRKELEQEGIIQPEDPAISSTFTKSKLKIILKKIPVCHTVLEKSKAQLPAEKDNVKKYAADKLMLEAKIKKIGIALRKAKTKAALNRELTSLRNTLKKISEEIRNTQQSYHDAQTDKAEKFEALSTLKKQKTNLLSALETLTTDMTEDVEQCQDSYQQAHAHLISTRRDYHAAVQKNQEATHLILQFEAATDLLETAKATVASDTSGGYENLHAKITSYQTLKEKARDILSQNHDQKTVFLLHSLSVLTGGLLFPVFCAVSRVTNGKWRYWDSEGKHALLRQVDSVVAGELIRSAPAPASRTAPAPAA